MKKCSVCGTVDEGGTEHTCPNCGEASWCETAKPEPKNGKKK